MNDFVASSWLQTELLFCCCVHQPSDRLKTDEEIAKEDQERLEKLEVGKSSKS